MHTIRPRHMLAAVALPICVLAGACTPAPATETTTTTTIATPTAPSISSFVVNGTVGPAPSLVTFGWSVSDPNGDALTCSIDGNGDGTAEVTVTNCNGTGSRNVEYAVAGQSTARLTVDDGISGPVSQTRTVTVPSGTSETFDIQIRGIGGLTTAQAAAFTSAEAYWESVIVRGIADISAGSRPSCLPDGSADLPSVVDDVIIDASVVPIDGAGSILGQAGPTCYSIANELPLHGVMEFDSADVANLIAAGSFDLVILHEMGHVLGFGTLWDTTGFGGVRKVLSGAGGINPVFTGPRGVAEYAKLGSAGNVPVENSGGSGTRDGHWRESRFDKELMTGYLDSGVNPVSRMTIASLADLGYQVSLGVAQPYSLPGALSSLRAAAADDTTILRPALGPARR